MADPVQWRCFHCDATFTVHQERWAREHFGANEGETPVCKMRIPGEAHLITALRKAQAELASYRSEDTDLMRAIESMEADYREKMIREEEKGYARGLKDYMAVEAERDKAAASVKAICEMFARYGADFEEVESILRHRQWDIDAGKRVATNTQ